MTNRVVPSDLKPKALDNWFYDVISDLKSQWINADEERREHIAEWLLESIEEPEQDDFWGTEGFFRD